MFWSHIYSNNFSFKICLFFFFYFTLYTYVSYMGLATISSFTAPCNSISSLSFTRQLSFHLFNSSFYIVISITTLSDAAESSIFFITSPNNLRPFSHNWCNSYTRLHHVLIFFYSIFYIISHSIQRVFKFWIFPAYNKKLLLFFFFKYLAL